MNSGLEYIVREAKNGDKDALETLIDRITTRIYQLALRTIYHPLDAEDATQEILIKIITHLSGFREESAFTTWMFRIATNHLLNIRCRHKEYPSVDFDFYDNMVANRSAPAWKELESEQVQAIIVKEIRISCLQTLLLCLNREHRIAYILGEIFDVTGEQGAQILDVTPEAFRKRVSRSRARLRKFMLKNCSLIESENPCSCRQIAAHRIGTGEVDPKHLVFATQASQHLGSTDLSGQLKEMDELRRIATLFKRDPDFKAPEKIITGIKHLLRSRTNGKEIYYES
jgi:RNA polymerase sigma factor (sigma-70 family)